MPALPEIYRLWWVLSRLSRVIYSRMRSPVFEAYTVACVISHRPQYTSLWDLKNRFLPSLPEHRPVLEDCYLVSPVHMKQDHDRLRALRLFHEKRIMCLHYGYENSGQENTLRTVFECHIHLRTIGFN